MGPIYFSYSDGSHLFAIRRFFFWIFPRAAHSPLFFSGGGGGQFVLCGGSQFILGSSGLCGDWLVICEP
jgi:hypothetical protein